MLPCLFRCVADFLRHAGSALHEGAELPYGESHGAAFVLCVFVA